MTQVAILDNSGTVINVVPTPDPSWSPVDGHSVVPTTNAQPGWTYANGIFTSPAVVAPTAKQQLSDFKSLVLAALDASDETMIRVQEAISLGLSTAATADVVAFVNYRRALRALLNSASVTTLPTPIYPAGT